MTPIWFAPTAGARTRAASRSGPRGAPATRGGRAGAGGRSGPRATAGVGCVDVGGVGCRVLGSVLGPSALGGAAALRRSARRRALLPRKAMAAAVRALLERVWRERPRERAAARGHGRRQLPRTHAELDCESDSGISWDLRETQPYDVRTENCLHAEGKTGAAGPPMHARMQHCEGSTLPSRRRAPGAWVWVGFGWVCRGGWVLEGGAATPSNCARKRAPAAAPRPRHAAGSSARARLRPAARVRSPAAASLPRPGSPRGTRVSAARAVGAGAAAVVVVVVVAPWNSSLRAPSFSSWGPRMEMRSRLATAEMSVPAKTACAGAGGGRRAG
jgi:hypothetical protein